MAEVSGSFVNVREQRVHGGFPGIARMDYGTVPAVVVLQTSAVGVCDCRSNATFIDISQGHGENGGCNFFHDPAPSSLRQ